MIDKMTKYNFVLLSGDAEAFLTKLQDAGVVDVTRSRKPVDESSMSLLARAEAMKKAMSLLSEADFADVEPASQDTDDAASLALEKFTELASVKQELDARRKELDLRKPWGDFDKEALDKLGEIGYEVRFFSCPVKSFDPLWAETYALQEVSSDTRKVHFVVVAAKGDDIQMTGATGLPSPDGSAAESKAEVEALERKLSGTKAAIMGLKARSEDIRKEYLTIAADLERQLAREHSKKEVEEKVCIMEGFVPDEDAAAIDALVESEPVIALKEDATKGDNPPIKLNNNKFTGMFRVLTDMYGRPDYDEFDPTPYISIFFLLFFAFCMGDMGYGIVLILGGLLMKKVKMMPESAPLVTTLGIGTVVVGFFFHTFFSMDMSKWGFIQSMGLDKVMVPGDQVVIPGMGAFDWNMILALICGVVHLSVAFVVKAIYASKKDGFLNSLGTWGWTLLLVGSAIAGALAIVGVLDKPMTKAVFITLGVVSSVGIFLLNDVHKFPLLNVGTGLWETYNTATGLLGDVLSYLRLYALGLAGGMLGAAFNDIALMALGDGGFGLNWLFFALIALIGHVLNIAMAALGAFVHPLRLNFLEFFKNSAYNGTGRTYDPLTNNNQ